MILSALKPFEKFCVQPAATGLIKMKASFKGKRSKTKNILADLLTFLKSWKTLLRKTSSRGPCIAPICNRCSSSGLII